MEFTQNQSLKIIKQAQTMRLQQMQYQNNNYLGYDINATNKALGYTYLDEYIDTELDKIKKKNARKKV